jgi:hypothetical protein
MDTVVGGFAGVGKVFSYVGLVFGVLVGILLIVAGSYVLKNDNYDSASGTIINISPPTAQYSYNNVTYTSILDNTSNQVFTKGEKVTVFIRPSQPNQGYSQPTPKGAGIGLIAGGFVVIAVGMLNTYFVRKNPGYAAVVGFADVIGMQRRHPLYGLI